MPALRNILVAVPPGSADAHPLEPARWLAQCAGARLTVLSVPPVAIPAIEIAREAESRGADLIVLGREPPAATDLRHDHGTVEGTVRRARVPCLLLPRGPLAVRRVLAAIDGGPDSRDIVRAALLIGRLFDATVRSLRVEQPVLAGVGAPAWPEDATLSASYGRGSVVDAIVREGDPVQEVLRVVREQGADLLVLGHHRGGPVSARATSGVAARLLQRAPCAVLTVPI
jgi:nucleotide-binding universal stress UspA family protein